MASKLDLKKTLEAFNRRDGDFYSGLTDEEQKAYVPIVLIRYMSSAPDQRGSHEEHLYMVNEVINESLWSLSKHPELQHRLIALCGTEKNVFHQWIAPNKKSSKNDQVYELFEYFHKGINQDEFSILISQTSIDQFEDLCKSMGWDDKKISLTVKQFEAIKGQKAQNDC